MSRPWMSVVTNAIIVLVAFFVVPIDPERAPLGMIVGVLVGGATLVGVVLIVVAEARGARRLTGWHLMLALEIALVVFAFAYYVLSARRPEEFAGLSTRVDALYFSTATAATVGYGDVHPTGQTARAIVTLHMVFNLVFIAAVVNLAREWMSARRAAAHPATDDRPRTEA